MFNYTAEMYTSYSEKEGKVYEAFSQFGALSLVAFFRCLAILEKFSFDNDFNIYLVHSKGN